MIYRVKRAFYDLQDSNHYYEAGDTFPRFGFIPTDRRIAELSGSDNRQGCALIEAVEATNKAPTPEPKEIPAEPVEAPKKGRRGRNKGDSE